jgi:hypothetical protein
MSCEDRPKVGKVNAVDSTNMKQTRPSRVQEVFQPFEIEAEQVP